MRSDFHPGDPVWITGSTGKKLPGVLVGESKSKARARVWHPTTGQFGHIQSYDWDRVARAGKEHIG